MGEAEFLGPSDSQSHCVVQSTEISVVVALEGQVCFQANQCTETFFTINKLGTSPELLEHEFMISCNLE